MKTSLQTNYSLIADRVKPGDRWRLVEDGPNGPIHPSLTETLETWFQKNQENVSFKLDPLDSKLYIIREVEVEIKPKPIKTFSLYGEYSEPNEND